MYRSKTNGYRLRSDITTYTIDTAKAIHCLTEARIDINHAQAIVESIAENGGDQVTKDYLDARVNELRWQLGGLQIVLAGVVIATLAILV